MNVPIRGYGVPGPAAQGFTTRTEPYICASDRSSDLGAYWDMAAPGQKADSALG
jgi:hypothetical protein